MPGSIFGNAVKRRFLTKANIIAHIEKAIVNNNIDRLTYYISLIDDINGKYIKSESLTMTFLNFICLVGKLEAFNLLVSKGARIDNDLLPAACYGKNIEIVRELIRSRVNVNDKDDEGFTPLLRLMLPPNPDETTLEIFNELIQNGANVNIVYVGNTSNTSNTTNTTTNYKLVGVSPLMLASKQCDSGKIIRELISKGANIDWTDSHGQTALSYAVPYNCQENVEILMSANANVNIDDNDGITVLMKALSSREENSLELVKKLMIQRPPPIEPIYLKSKDSNGRTNLMFAIDGRSIEVIKLIIDMDTTDINSKDSSGNTALIYATKDRSTEIVRLLLDAHADINIQDSHGNTALILAAQWGLIEMVRLLLDAGATAVINLQDYRGRTALMFAADRGHVELVRLLLDAGADKEIVDNQGNTTSSYGSNLEIRLLLQAERVGKLWKGWDRGDVEALDRVFNPDSFNMSHCPICLKFALRGEGCKYMTHDCASFSQHYNVELYEKYKIRNLADTEYYIQWCTVCGRVSNNHKHYALSRAEGPVPGFQLGVQASYFGDECKPYGGGNEEKAKRYNAIRRKAWEIKDMAGKISDSEAMDQLIIAGWNGPLEPNSVEADLKAKRWLEHPAENFPKPRSGVVNVFLYPDIQVPAERKMPKLIHGENATSMEEGDVLLFFHPKETGESYHETINPNSLTNKEEFIRQLKAFYYDEEEIEHFGRCFDKQCKAILYPIEVKTALELYGPLSEEETKFYNDYKIKFNEKMRVRKGGAVDSMFVELTDGQCFLPPKTTKPKKGGKTRMKKTRKRKTRRRR